MYIAHLSHDDASISHPHDEGCHPLIFVHVEIDVIDDVAACGARKGRQRWQDPLHRAHVQSPEGLTVVKTCGIIARWRNR